ncbi:stromal membrane-associated protein 1 isoform X9 [Oncorhynchus kisutch]|uniref:stromal membrane-associated protein 1 isoform X9 n=1 Tax=Oncorhynchus kisutch TaxID=8019 RepID=UPI0012DEE39E|nr:stromal membrane-associated protein 1-like isoform X9 [Oncorhynchus kisutch]
MSTRSEREKAQKLNEQHQAILSKMLREDDNKHCADCEAKGPRWASWNLGVFMCIRCAGIHRNLGVHISRVKSVNLDQWTQEQIQSMVDMGNNKAKQLYEAHLPDTFRRPQTDQAVEFFIRDKYERKKYYDQNGLKTASKSSDAAAFSTSPASQAAEKNRQEKEREKKKREKDLEKVNRPSSSEKKKAELQTDSRANPRRTPEPAIDLLGLDAPAGGAATSSAAPVSDEDIFGPMVSNPLPSSNNTQVPPPTTTPRYHLSPQPPGTTSSSGPPPTTTPRYHLSPQPTGTTSHHNPQLPPLTTTPGYHIFFWTTSHHNPQVPPLTTTPRYHVFFWTTSHHNPPGTTSHHNPQVPRLLLDHLSPQPPGTTSHHNPQVPPLTTTPRYHVFFWTTSHHNPQVPPLTTTHRYHLSPQPPGTTSHHNPRVPHLLLDHLPPQPPGTTSHHNP